MKIDQFLNKIQRHLNLQKFISTVSWSLLAAGIIGIVYALSYILRGHAMIASGYWPLIGSSIVIGSIIASVNRNSREEAAHYADKKWQLKDLMLTTIQLQSSQNDNNKQSISNSEVVELIVSQAEQQAAKVNQDKLTLKWPKHIIFTGTSLLAVSIYMLTIPPSEAVVMKLAHENMIESRSNEVRNELEEYLDELDKSLDDDEKEALKLDELKQWVEEMKITGNEREAMKQFAKLEQKISLNLSQMNHAKEERALKKMAQELRKTDSQQARAIRKDIEKRDYDKAGKKLEDMQFKKNTESSQKKSTPLTEQQKKAAMMRAITKRMANANKSSNQSSSQGQSQGNQSNGSGSNGDNSQQSEIASMVSQLDKTLSELEKELRKCELDGKKLSNQKCESLCNNINDQLCKLSKKMCQTSAQCKASFKLKCLRQGLCQSQSYALGRCNKPSSRPGGQQAGVGSNHSERQERSDHLANGNMAQLQGIKNQTGPSQSSVEEAESGTAISSKNESQRERSYQRSFESFVQRDDIPEELKSGVQNYFESIHQYQEPTIPADQN
ncbi:hypothetical protein [Persicirhabdus sediminis]|uniref:Uncharacterized protein n=1 Tax=Persicirhabdus sediminis TaxID=454144 RepID=A0A8J7MDF0_9BACT|nr:hypothetical protein [Persicirhabdus sediminis]MBK1790606.1 hypothetical protein [Persicirhabdus sediminis]